MRPELAPPQRKRARMPRGAAPQAGFALVAAMFVIIIIALVIAAMMRMAGNQHGTNSLAIQQARAYQAARAGIDWGISRALAGNCAGSSTLSLAVSNLSEFSNGLQVSCTRVSYSENGVPVVIYTLTATAQNGAVGSKPDYAYRRLTATVENGI
jgi:MSHA biogenesis protein MshP